MDNLIAKSNNKPFKMLYAWSGQSLCAINGKTNEIVGKIIGYQTYIYR